MYVSTICIEVHVIPPPLLLLLPPPPLFHAL